MLRRKTYQDLLKWKNGTSGKALCIIGARQIGKTTLIREFGKNEYEHHAMQTEQWKFEHCIVFSKSNVEVENGILYLPWYMVMFFQQQKEPEQMIYEIDLSSLSQNS